MTMGFGSALSSLNPMTSAHYYTKTHFIPKAAKKGIIYSQALRYRRIITDDMKLLTDLEKLRNNLIKRGYHLADITSQFDRVM